MCLFFFKRLKFLLKSTSLFFTAVFLIYSFSSKSMAEDWSMIVIPDMHIDSLKNNPINQLKWIKANQIPENILLVSAVGDYLTIGNSQAAWRSVKNVWNSSLFMERGKTNDPFTTMAISFVIGNHDYDSYRPRTGNTPGWKKTDSTSYRAFFGKQNWLRYSWYGHEDLNDENHVQFIQADGYTIMHMDIEYDIGNSATQAVTGISDGEAGLRLAWLDGTLSKYSQYPTIITTHDYLSEQGNLSPAGKKIWAILKKHSNVFMVLSGHVCKVADVDGTGSAVAIAQRSGMGPVLQLLSDYQNFRRTRAWTRQLKFTGPANNKLLTWTTFSVSSMPRVNLSAPQGNGSWRFNLSTYTNAKNT